MAWTRTSSEGPFEAGITAADLLRAQLYRFLSGLPAAPPEADFVAAIAGLDGHDTAFGRASSALAEAARASSPAAAAEKCQDPFIGLGRDELVPFGPCRLTGFLYERSLAKLR